MSSHLDTGDTRETVFVTGATGTIGLALTNLLAESGRRVIVLTRNRGKAERLFGEERLAESTVEIVEGDPIWQGKWQEEVRGCSAVVHLAGESLAAQRWDAQFKQKLHDSRVDSTRLVGEAILACPNEERPKVLVTASGIDYYGFAEIENFDDDEVSESEPAGESWLSRLCRDWEQETEACRDAGVRVVCMRTGLVLAKEGALQKLATPFKMRVGGRMGHGRQWMSWVHIEDVIRAYLFAIETPALRGAVNLVAPGNLRNREFAEILARTLGTHAKIPTPGRAVRIAAGELAEYILKGRNAVPAKLQEEGFCFRHPELLAEDLKNLL